jgi:phosphoribosylamine-glycine ligase
MAKILLVTYSMYGSWFSIQLEQEGHSVDIWLQDHYEDFNFVLDGLIKHPSKGKPNFKKYDLVLFDLTGRPKIAEEVMAMGIPCIGDGDLNSELEDDRLFGVEIMEECGINVPSYEVFNDIAAAKKYVQRVNKAFVFKPNGGQEQDTATTYVSKSSDDMLRYLDKLGTITKGVEFILQEVVNGTEISVEGWFNGEDFYLINGTLEEKKFMEGNKGPNTGCAGNLVWVFDQVNKPLIYREGLVKLKDFLKQYNYKGMIDLNTIVTAGEIYGLEWTPRFGYDASATLYSCINNDTLGDFFGAVASGAVPEYSLSHNYASAVRLTIPPYPSEIKGKHPDSVPIEGINEDDIPKNCFLYDCANVDGDSLVTAGVSGLVCVPIQAGNTPQEAWEKVYRMVRGINIPDVQYRNDLEKTTMERYTILERQGWFN